MAIPPVQTTLEYTGERFIPGKGGAQIHYEHFHRYGFARTMVRGKKVLDIGSSEGYGAALLAQEASWVLALDINQDVVRYAKRTYRKDNVHFISANAAHIPTPGNMFDVVVAFEMIEHTYDQDLILSEIRRVLKSDGILVLSSPNKEVYSGHNGRTNPYHVKELSQKELEDFLGKYFSVVRLFGQKPVVGSAILEEGKESYSPDTFEFSELSLAQQTTRQASAFMKDPMYFIAVSTNNASVNTGNVCSFSLLHDPSYQFVRENTERIARKKDRQIEEKNRKAAYLAEIISLRDDTIQELNNKLRVQSNKIQEQNKEIQVLHDFAIKVKNTLAYRIYKRLKGIR